MEALRSLTVCAVKVGLNYSARTRIPPKLHFVRNKSSFYICTRYASTSSNTTDQLDDPFPSYDTASAVDVTDEPPKTKRISQAMSYYLAEMEKRDERMRKETAEFEMGRRHLANMMGVSVDQMGDEEIDRAINYLLPSGLFEKKARPMMKHPSLIYPEVKSQQFDESGRPFHHLFYTLTPTFYEDLSMVAAKTEEVKAYDVVRHVVDEALVDEEEALNLAGSMWLTHEQMVTKYCEPITERAYNQLIVSLEYLISLPYAYKVKSFLEKFRKNIITTGGDYLASMIPEIQTDPETGGRFATAVGHRKNAYATVTLTENGTGEYNVNGLQVEDFIFLKTREILLAPFVLLSAEMGRWDVHADVYLAKEYHRWDINEIGRSASAGAVRLGIARALAAFLPPSDVKKLQLSGLLTKDVRRREREKINQPGARRKATWKRR